MSQTWLPDCDTARKEWFLRLKDGDAAKLEQIPGLRVVVDTAPWQARGKIDAVAVACYRLGRPLPTRPTDIKPRVLRACPELYQFQEDGTDILANITHVHGAALLADDMGLGKTVQAIYTARARNGRVFVICPAGVRETWWRELLRVGVPASTLSILGPPSDAKTKEAWLQSPSASVVVCSYELAQPAFEYAFAKSAPKTVIFDEAHMLCGRHTNRSAVASNIANLSRYAIAITGTPMWSRPRDFHKLLTILYGGRFGSAGDFDKAYCDATPGQYGGLINSGVSRPEELKLRLSYYMLRRTKAEVKLQLPKLQRTVVWADPTDGATNAYVAWQMKRGGHEFQNAIRATLAAKMQEAVDRAVEAKRFLLVTWLREDAAKLTSMIEKEGVPCYLITGDIPTAKRDGIIRAAAVSGAGIVATLDSVSTGVDGLQHVASVLIVHAMDPTPLKLLQLEARLDRIGQLDPVQVFYLAQRDSMDELIVERAVEKLDAFAATMPGGAQQETLAKALQGPALDDPALLKSLYDLLPETA